MYRLENPKCGRGLLKSGYELHFSIGGLANDFFGKDQNKLDCQPGENQSAPEEFALEPNTPNNPVQLPVYHRPPQLL